MNTRTPPAVVDKIADLAKRKERYQAALGSIDQALIELQAKRAEAETALQSLSQDLDLAMFIKDQYEHPAPVDHMGMMDDVDGAETTAASPTGSTATTPSVSPPTAANNLLETAWGVRVAGPRIDPIGAAATEEPRLKDRVYHAMLAARRPLRASEVAAMLGPQISASQVGTCLGHLSKGGKIRSGDDGTWIAREPVPELQRA